MNQSTDLMPHANSYAWSKEEVRNILYNHHDRISYKTWNKNHRGGGFHQRIYKKIYIDNEYTYYVKCILCGDGMNNIFKYDWRTGTHSMKKHFESDHSHLTDDQIPQIDESLDCSKNLATDPRAPAEKDKRNMDSYLARKEAAKNAIYGKDGDVVIKAKPKRIRLRKRQLTDERISLYMYDSDDGESDGCDGAEDGSLLAMVTGAKVEKSDHDQAVNLLTNLLDDNGGKKRLEDYTDEDFDRERKELRIKKARMEVKELEIRIKRQEEQKRMYQSVHEGFKNLVHSAKCIIDGVTNGQASSDSTSTFIDISHQVSGQGINQLLQEAYRETIKGFHR